MTSCNSVDETVRANRIKLFLEDLHITIMMTGYKKDLLEEWEAIKQDKSELGGLRREVRGGVT